MSNDRIRPSRLVIYVPGLRHSQRHWDELIDRLAREPEYAAACWVPFRHRLTVLSIANLASKSRELAAFINGKWLEAGGYKDVVVVAHSIGGPIARAAYLVAAEPPDGSSQSEWTKHVSRFVLFASINRGIDVRRMPQLQFIAWLAGSLTFLSKFCIVQAYRGSNFLTNLRIDWIRHFGSSATNAATGAGRAKVIQILGTKDSLVGPDDSRDVLAMWGARELAVPGADHSNVYHLGADPEVRYAIFREAFCGSPSPSQRSQAPAAAARVVFLLHGIRSSNVEDWIADIKAEIAVRAGRGALVKHPGYGYFSAAQFGLPSVRRRNIPTFRDWYTEVLADHPTARYSVIAHSNGTYILGHTLLAAPGMRFDDVVLVGSVLPEKFWGRFEDGRLKVQVARIQNHRARRDWPVALLCSALRGLGMRDIGTAGFGGFTGQSTEEVAYYKGGHSDPLQPDFHEGLVRFALGEDVDEPDSLVRDAGMFRQLSNMAPPIASSIAILLVVAAGLYVFGDDSANLWARLAHVIGATGLGWFALRVL